MNVGLGYLALANNTTGSFNAAIGYGALYSNTTGIDNVAIGDSNLVDNTTGSYNVALGAGSLINNTTGNDNIGIGWLSLGSNLTGSDNIAIGNGALENATNVSNAIAIGEEAFHNLSYDVYGTMYPGYGGATPSTGIAIGHQAMYSASITDGEIAIGDYALYSAATPFYSMAIGFKALYSVINNYSSSIAVGDWALPRQTTGSMNAVFGSSGWFLTTGSGNSIFGQYAGTKMTTGSENTIIGANAGRVITTGYNNVLLGYQAGTKLNSTSAGLKDAHWNIGIGGGTLGGHIPAATPSFDGLYGNTYPSYGDATPSSGYFNVAIGASALSTNTTGYNNIAVGPYAMGGNDGLVFIDGNFNYNPIPNVGSHNIAHGYKTLYKNASGYRNIASGYEALYNNSTGTDNIAMGWKALYSNIGGATAGDGTSGFGNIGIGLSALQLNTTGKTNTAVGYSAGNTATTGSNNTYLGYNAQPASVTDGNKITLGDSNITHLRCQVTSITALSDARDKTGIQDSVYGLEFINKLRPVTFEWNMRDGGKAGQKDLGFLAQDFVELEDELDAHEVLNLTMRSNPDKLEASYGRLVPILVRAVQDLSAEVQSLKQLLQSKE